MNRPVLQLHELTLSYETRTGSIPTLKGVSFEVYPGEVLGLLGPSGSGKTTVAGAVLGLLPPAAQITGGSITLQGRDMVGASETDLNNMRGHIVGWIPQDTGSSLNPVKRIGEQVADALVLHSDLDRLERRDRAIELLERVGLREPAKVARLYPHELSGGMRQRVLIASAIACSPKLLVADEPTSALDAVVKNQILDEVDGLRRRTGTGVLLVTHDVLTAARRCDRVVVLKDGKIVEELTGTELLAQPKARFTRELVAALPRSTPTWRVVETPPETSGVGVSPLLQVSGVSKTYARKGESTAPAVSNLTFEVGRGETVAIVGESGSGKSTTARILTGLMAPTMGDVTVSGRSLAGGASGREARRSIQLVQQSPFSSIDPRYTVGAAIAEPIRLLTAAGRGERKKRVLSLAAEVDLNPRLLGRRARDLSGGQLQRVAIARALAPEPQLIVCDEAVSALDAVVQRQVLELLSEVQAARALSYVFISHDIAVVAEIAHRTLVLKNGVTVDYGLTRDILTRPSHEYTAALIAASGTDYASLDAQPEPKTRSKGSR